MWGPPVSEETVSGETQEKVPEDVGVLRLRVLMGIPEGKLVSRSVMDHTESESAGWAVAELGSNAARGNCVGR